MNRKVYQYDWIDKVIIFLLVASTRIYIALNAWPVYTISDEVSAISIAARIAGYNWSDVVSNAGYYGVGYLFIYAPLFMLKISPVYIYRIMVIGSAIILGLSSLVCKKIIDVFFENINRCDKIGVSVACGCLSIMSTYQPSMRNEEMLLLMSWLVVLNVLYILNDEKDRLHRGLLLFLCLYSLTLHTRAIIFIVGVIVISALLFIFHRKPILKFVDIVILGGGYFAVNSLLKLYRQSIWTVSVRNASVSKGLWSSLSRISIDKYYLKSLLSILFGQMYTAYATSGGIFIISLVAICVIAFKMKKSCVGNYDYNLLVVGCFLTFCICVTIAGQMLTWGDNVYLGFITEEEGWIYGYKAFTYLRYSGYLMPPLFMIGLILFQRHREETITITLVSSVIVCILFLLWCDLIFPYMKDRKSLLFLTNTILSNEQNVTEGTWILTFKMVFLFAFLWILAAKGKNTLIWTCIALSLYASVERVCAFDNIEKYNEKKCYNYANAGTDFIQFLIKNGSNQQCIYSIDTIREDDHQLWYMYQFMNYTVHIIPNIPSDVDLEEVYLLTNGVICDDVVKKMEIIQLDENEYLYYKGKNAKEMVSNYLDETRSISRTG